jgi:Mg2+/Co2+ transporter CorB
MVASSKVMEGVNIYVALSVLLLIVVLSIIFDIIGTAVTAAEEAPFHAMASRKLYGARQALRLIRNADKVSNFCNDVVGDICGVISGSASALIVMKIAQSGDKSLVEFIMAGLVASLTVGGKSIGKTIAIKNSNYIVYKVSVIIKFVFGKIGFRKKTKKSKL